MVSIILRHVKFVPPLDQVHPRCRLDQIAHLALVEGEGSLLELLLHVALAKEAPDDVSVSRRISHRRDSQIAPLASAAAVRLGRREFRQRLGAAIFLATLVRLYLLLVFLYHLPGVLDRARNLGLPPTSRTPAVAMFDEEMGTSDLAFSRRESCGRNALGAVVGGHVCLELVRVGSGWWFPSRVFRLGVEVVWKVLGVGAAHLPSLGETSFSGRLGCVRGCEAGRDDGRNAYHCWWRCMRDAGRSRRW